MPAKFLFPAAAYNALVERAIAISAEDMNVPLPEDRAVELESEKEA